MDKKKKIIVIVFVVFLGALALFAKIMFFTTEEVELKEFSLTTPEVNENELLNESKRKGYDSEVNSYSKQGGDLLLGTNTNKLSENFDYNPFKNKRESANVNSPVQSQQTTSEENRVAREELEHLLKMQAEIDAEAQRDLISSSNNELSGYTSGIQDDLEEEIISPPTLAEKWKEVKGNKNHFNGVTSSFDVVPPLNLIPVETVDEAILKMGSTLAIRLKQRVYLEKENIYIPKDAILYGKASFSGLDRLSIDIVSYKENEKLHPVEFVIYDFDGRPGVHLSSNSWPKIPVKVSKEVLEYVKKKGTSPTFSGNNSIDPEEIKLIATVSAANEVFQELLERKRVFMPQKYHLWINVPL